MLITLSTRLVVYLLITNLLETRPRERTTSAQFRISGYGLSIVLIVRVFAIRALAVLAGHLDQPLGSLGIAVLRDWTAREFSTPSSIWLVVIEKAVMPVAMEVIPAKSRLSWSALEPQLMNAYPTLLVKLEKPELAQIPVWMGQKSN